MMTPEDVGKLLKQKYPGKYDDVMDADLGSFAIKKYGSPEAAVNNSPMLRAGKLWEMANTPLIPTFDDEPIKEWQELPRAAAKEAWNAAAGFVTPLNIALGAAGRLRSLAPIPQLAGVGLAASMVGHAASRTGEAIKTAQTEGFSPETARQGIGAATSVGFAALPAVHAIKGAPETAKAVKERATSFFDNVVNSKLFAEELGELDVTPKNLLQNAIAVAQKALPWYKYGVEDILSKKMGKNPDTMYSTDAVKGMLNDPNVRKGDLYWNNIDDFLEQKKAMGKKVSFNDIQNHIIQNGISVQIQRRTENPNRIIFNEEEAAARIMGKNGTLEEFNTLKGKLAQGETVMDRLYKLDLVKKLDRLFLDWRDGTPEQQAKYEAIRAKAAEIRDHYEPSVNDYGGLTDFITSRWIRNKPDLVLADHIRDISPEIYNKVLEATVEDGGYQVMKDRYQQLHDIIDKGLEAEMAVYADENIGVTDLPAKWRNYRGLSLHAEETYRMITTRAQTMQHRIADQMEKQYQLLRLRRDRQSDSERRRVIEDKMRKIRTTITNLRGELAYDYSPSVHLDQFHENFPKDVVVHNRGDFRTLVNGKKSWTADETQPDYTKDYLAYGSPDPDSPLSKQADMQGLERINKELEGMQKDAANEANADNLAKIQAKIQVTESAKERIEKRLNYAERMASTGNRRGSMEQLRGASQDMMPYSVKEAPFITQTEKAIDLGIKSWIKNAIASEPNHVPDVIGFVDGNTSAVLQGYGQRASHIVARKEIGFDGTPVYSIQLINTPTPTPSYYAMYARSASEMHLTPEYMNQVFRPKIAKAIMDACDNPESTKGARTRLRNKFLNAIVQRQLADRKTRLNLHSTHIPARNRPAVRASIDASMMSVDGEYMLNNPEAAVLELPKNTAFPESISTVTQFWGIKDAADNFIAKRLQKLAKQWGTQLTFDQYFDRPQNEIAKGGEFWQHSLHVNDNMRKMFKEGRVEVSPLIPIGVGAATALAAWKAYNSLNIDDKKDIKEYLKFAGMTLTAGVPMLFGRTSIFESKVRDGVDGFPNTVGKVEAAGRNPGRGLKDQVLFVLKGKGVGENDIALSGIEPYLNDLESKGVEKVSREELLRFIDTPNPLRGLEVKNSSGDGFLYDHDMSVVREQAPWYAEAANRIVEPQTYTVTMLRLREAPENYTGQGLIAKHFWKAGEENYIAHSRWGQGKDASGGRGRIVLERQEDWLQNKGKPGVPKIPLPFPKRTADMNMLWLLKDSFDNGDTFVAFPRDIKTIEEVQVWDHHGGVNEYETGKWRIGQGWNVKDVTPVIKHYTKEIPEWLEKNAKKYGFKFGPEEIVRADGRRETWNLVRFEPQTKFKQSLSIPSIFLPTAGAAAYAAWNAMTDDDKQKARAEMAKGMPEYFNRAQRAVQ